MRFNDYTAWLDGVEVAYGREKEVTKKAKAFFLTTNKPESTLKVTKGPTALFCSSIIVTQLRTS